MRVVWCDCEMKPLKKLIAAAIARPSTSHGNQFDWFMLSFWLKKPATLGLLFLTAYIVAPMPPGGLAAPSVIIHSWSVSLGRTTALLDWRCFWADLKASSSDSLHSIFWVDDLPAVVWLRGCRKYEQLGMTLDNIL